MQSSVEPLEGNKVKVSVALEQSEWDKALNEAFREIAKQVRIPGFRPGKAPRAILEQRLGVDAGRSEALRRSIDNTYSAVVAEHEIDVIAPPEVEIVEGKEDGLPKYEAVVEIRPIVGIPGHEGLSVKIPTLVVTDDDLQKAVDRFRSADATLNDVDRPIVDGDQATIDIRSTLDGEDIDQLTADDYLYEVGSKSVVPELDAELLGAQKGDEKSFVAVMPDSTELTFTVKINNIQEKVLPELDDEWVQNNSDFKTVDEFTGDVRKRLETVRKMNARVALREEALIALMELVVDDIPEPLIENEVQRQIRDLARRLDQQGATVDQWLEATGRSEEDVVESLRGQAAESVKADLALRALAEARKIEASDDDLEEHLVEMGARFGQTPQQVRKAFDRNSQMSAVRWDVRKAKALAWLVDSVLLVDADTSAPISRAELETEVEAEGEE